ncbi:DUF202 domain-containing protein [Yokenella regensburgei]|uniref:YidH family protein n=1 Tax=Yokenella regensburgei TaxID=158877 RepID=UPI003F169428
MSWQTQGKSPDYRFTLANERTFLAWIRTALAFMAAAIGIDQLAPNFVSPGFHDLLVALLGGIAALLAWYAWRRWALNERAMRNDAALDYPRMLLWLSYGLSIVIVVTLTLLLML